MRALATTSITDAMLYSSSVPETDHAAWVSGTTYAAGDRVIRAATHRIYERLIAGAGTTAPESDSANWRDVAPTNRWAMFDGSAQDQTTAASTLSVYVVPGVAINDIVLIGLLATQVQVYGGATGATLLRTVAVPAPTSPAASVTLEITGLGIAAGQRIGLVITRSGTVGVSAACYGTFSNLGSTLAGAQVSLVDYSRVSTDAYGVTSITRRGYSRRLQGAARVAASALDAVTATVESLRQQVVYWSVVDGFESFSGLGFPRAYSVDVRGPTSATYSLTLETLARDDLVIAPGYDGSTGSSVGSDVMPLVEGLGVRLVAGNIEFGWTPCRTTGYIATEIRTGASWSAGVTAFYGLANRWVWAWPEDGTYQLRFRHVGATSTSAADAVADVVVAGNTVTVSFTIVWDDGAGADVVWDDGTGGDALWGTSLTRDPRIGTADLQPQAVGTDQLQAGAVGSAQLVDGAVGSVQLADGAATSSKIGAGAVDTLKLAPNAATIVYTAFDPGPNSFNPAA